MGLRSEQESGQWFKEEKRCEMSLQKRNELEEFNRYIRASLVPMLLVDSNGFIAAANEEAAIVLDCRESELPGQRFTSVIALEPSTSYSNLVSSAKSGPLSAPGTRYGQSKKQGIPLTLRIGCLPIRNREYGLVSMTPTGTSTASNKTPVESATKDAQKTELTTQNARREGDRSRDALAQRELEFELLAETVPEIVFITDSSGQAEYINRYWEAFTGMPIEETKGLGWASALHPDDRNRVVEKWTNALITGDSFQDEYRFKSKEGEFRWFLARAVPMRDEHGQVYKWFGVCTDIDDHKKLSAELELARDKAEKATQAKSIFLAHISHEVRTPMNAIIGMSKMLLASNLDQDIGQYVKSIGDAASSLVTLINDILDISKVEAGRIELDKSEFEIVKVVEGACQLYVAFAESKGLRLLTQIDPSLTNNLMYGDSEKIRQVLLNLVSNAIKFTERGEILVSAESDSAREDQIDVRFSIKDQGIGITEDQQSRLFEPFIQAHSSISTKYGGTGLGLSICKRLVELMGGSMGLHSIEGAGSTFWFTIPLEPRALTAYSHKLSVAAPGTDDSKLLPPRYSDKILIAEDNTLNRQVVEFYVEQLGYRCDIVADGGEAVKAVMMHDYALILMDCQMPVMDGFSATKAIREFESLAKRHTPIIALTAHAMTGDRQRCLDAGMDDYLSKPIDPNELNRLFNQWISVKSQEHGRSLGTLEQFDEPQYYTDTDTLDILRLTALLEAYGSKSDQLQSFFSRSADLLESLRKAARESNRKIALSSVRELKELCLTIRAERLEALCRDIESNADEGQWESVLNLINKISGTLEAARANL